MATDTAPAWSFRHHWMAHTATHAMMRPDKPALRYLGATTTWAQLSRRSLQLAAALADRGVGEGDRVATLTLNHPWFVESVFAANSLGAMAVPLNFRLAPPELGHILGDCTPSAIVVDAQLLPQLRAVPEADSIGTVIVIGEPPEGEGGHVRYEDFLAGFPPMELPDIAEDATALIMYTSGTTGLPKGVMLSHRNMQVQAVTCIRAMDMFDDSDVGFLTAPFFHIAGLGSIVANFLVGGTVVIHPLGAFDPAAVLDAYEREGATIVFNVPQQWDLICAQPGIDKRDLRLRVISWGAAPASDATLRAMDAAFPRALNVAVFGQTETSPITCVLRGEDALRRLGSVGRPIPTIQYRIVDAEMNDVPAKLDRRDRLPRTHGDPGLLEQAGRDRGGVPRRMVPLRRPGQAGRRRLRLGRRPQEGHDHQRRREHLLRRGGEHHRRAPRRARGRRGRPPRRAVGAGPGRLRGRGAGRHPVAGPAHRVPRRAAGLVQDPQGPGAAPRAAAQRTGRWSRRSCGPRRGSGPDGGGRSDGPVRGRAAGSGPRAPRAAY